MIKDLKLKYGKSAPAFEEAVDLLNEAIDPAGKIMNSAAYWLPLQFLYKEMIKNKELVRLSDLTTDKKEYYWQMVKRFDWPLWKKIAVAQALYVYQIITKE